jgi:hypothetical protein
MPPIDPPPPPPHQPPPPEPQQPPPSQPPYQPQQPPPQYQTPVYLPPPVLPPADRVRNAYLRRNETDYIFNFWTALGWTILTCGVYGLYVIYQLVRRSRDHNLRRLELLDAANAVAWERATAQGLEEELRPNFERVATNLDALRRLSHEFRDPIIWMVLAIVASGIVQIVAYVLLDGDLVKHDYNEGAAENELAFIFTRLGTPVDHPDPSRLHQPQNYVGRVVATIFSCGFYSYWWLYNMMEDGNQHFIDNWAWEDSLAEAVQAGQLPA